MLLAKRPSLFCFYLILKVGKSEKQEKMHFRGTQIVKIASKAMWEISGIFWLLNAILSMF